MARLLLLALAVLAVGCGGGDRPQGIEVTEAGASDLPPGPRRTPTAFDTVYADTTFFGDLRADSLAVLRADSLRRDSLRLDSVARAEAARPDFRRFWPQFRAAVGEGRAAVAQRTTFSEALPRGAFDDRLFDAAFGPGPFREGVLALTARDFRRDGTAREATVTVGYDGEGRVVPEDEAVTESAVVLRFDVAGGAYRLVGITLAG